MNSVQFPTLLVFSLHGLLPPQQIAFESAEVRIGRDRTCHICIADPSVSRIHCIIKQTNQGWHLYRYTQAHEVFINGATIEETLLSSGDRIVLGGTLLCFDSKAASTSTGDLTGLTVMISDSPMLLVELDDVRYTVPLKVPSLSLGRGQRSQIVIPSMLVSEHHAQLTRNADGVYQITDNESQNGLLLNGTRLHDHVLEDGEIISIGEPQKKGSVTLTYIHAGTRSTNTASSPMSHHLASAWKHARIPQDGTPLSLGRDPHSSCYLPHPLISWHHAQVRCNGAQVLIEDLKSTNGVYVNFTRVTEVQELITGDILQFGPYQIRFDGESLHTDSLSQVGMRIEAQGISRALHSRGNRKILLDNISLHIQPGEFVTIVGGSGAGKTTLMKALAGINPPTEGHVYLNSIDSVQHAEWLRGRIGYVPQEDIVHADLSVHDALFYVARLRLAQDLSMEEIEQRITSTLVDLELSNKRDTIIAKLSGGEKKRVNIAVELLNDVPILFLDEPNAPLDPHLRDEMRSFLRRLAQKGRTIVMVSHMPEDALAADLVAFMGTGGRLCYFGPPNDALAFFNVKTFASIYSCVNTGSLAGKWRDRFALSPTAARYLTQRKNLTALPVTNLGTRPAIHERQNISRDLLTTLQQLKLLTQRYFQILRQDRKNLLTLLLQAPIIAVLLALVSGQGVFQSNQGPIDAQKVLFLLAVVMIWFGISNSVREISKENAIFARERLAGLKSIPYILSKVVVLAGLCFVQAFVLLAIIVLKTGVPIAGVSLFLPPPIELYIGMFLAGLAGVALGLLVSAFAGNADKAISAVPLVLLPQLLLAGVIFPVSGPIGFVADITISRWAVQALGTSADLDRLYYVQLAQASEVATQPHQTSLNPTIQANPAASFAVDDYDSNPTAAHYPSSMKSNTLLTAARNSRRQHLLETWGAMAGLFCLFLGLATLQQQRKVIT